ncbi:hypothetical protein FHY19_002579 [Xanthomonas arboricola]|nr:hypothetical protein [Xanthomonas sp. 4461]
MDRAMFRCAEQCVLAVERASGRGRPRTGPGAARCTGRGALQCPAAARNRRRAAPGSRYASASVATCRRVRPCRAQVVRSPDTALRTRTAGRCALRSDMRQVVVGDCARRSTSCGDRVGATMRPKRCRCRMACMVFCDDRRAHPARRRSPPLADRSCRRVATIGYRQAKWRTARLATSLAALKSPMRIAAGATSRAPAA